MQKNIKVKVEIWLWKVIDRIYYSSTSSTGQNDEHFTDYNGMFLVVYLQMYFTSAFPHFKTKHLVKQISYYD